MTNLIKKFKSYEDLNWNIIELLYVFQFIILNISQQEINKLHKKLMIIYSITKNTTQISKKEIADVKEKINQWKNFKRSNINDFSDIEIFYYQDFKTNIEKYNNFCETFDFYINKNYLFNSLTSQIEFLKEGSLKLDEHFSRERDWKIISAKKQQAILENGFLECEVCKFNFEKKYGDRGHNFAEVHHIKPISNYEDEDITALKDLVILCSNCHRMIHRKEPWISVEELKKLISKVAV